MVKSVFEELEKIWYPKENIFSEWFTPSWRNETVLKEIFINGNIPFIKEISWGIILLSFLLAWLFVYKTWNSTLFDSFLWFPTFQWFIFNLSWIAVVFVMLIRPISDIFPKSNFLRKLKTFRKPLGILSAMLILINFSAKYFYDPASFVTYFNSNRWRLNDFSTLISRVSEVTAVILLITSNTFSQKFLWKWWKAIQYLSYPYFITWWIAAWSYANTFSEQFQYYWLIWIWIILLIMAFILNFLRRKKENS